MHERYLNQLALFGLGNRHVQTAAKESNVPLVHSLTKHDLTLNRAYLHCINMLLLR